MVLLVVVEAAVLYWCPLLTRVAWQAVVDGVLLLSMNVVEAAAAADLPPLFRWVVSCELPAAAAARESRAPWQKKHCCYSLFISVYYLQVRV